MRVNAGGVMAKLSSKQEAFCREYIVDFNGTQAAIRAGYSEKTANRIASQILSKLDIQERIAELIEVRNKRVDLNADWVLMSAKRVFDRCMQEEAVLDRNGEPVMCKTANGELAAAYQFNANGANKALETIGKHVNVNAFTAIKEDIAKDEIIQRVVVEVVSASQNISNSTSS